MVSNFGYLLHADHRLMPCTGFAAILDFIVLRRFFREHPNAPPGDLTHLKQSLVGALD